MNLPYVYGYLVFGLLYSAPWIILFILRKDLRMKMFIFSCIIGVCGMIWDPYFFRDYWHPFYLTHFPFEDFIYSFFTGGISCVLYEEIYKRRFAKQKKKK